MGDGAFQPNPFAPPSESADAYAWPNEDHHQEHRLATYIQRFLGWVVDGTLAGVAMLPGMVLGAILMAGEHGRDMGPWLVTGGLVGMLLLVAFQWYLISTTGQSIAKRWLGMRIVRVNGELPGFLHGVVLRSWIVAMMASVPLVGGGVGLIDALLIFAGTTRQTLHDRIAGTIVIQTR